MTVIRKRPSCFTQSCEQIVTGRNLRYDTALRIIQEEEYLMEAEIGLFAHGLRRKKRGILAQTIESYFYHKNVTEIVQPKPGLFWASLLTMIIIPIALLRPLPEILPGQAPPSSPQPGSIGGGGLPQNLDNPELGEALALVPDGLQPVSVFPPFQDSRLVPAIGVIFSEAKSPQIRRKRLRRYRRSEERPSFFWRFLGALEDNIICLKPRLERQFTSRETSYHQPRAILDSVDDCFPDEDEPKYGFRVKIFLKRDEECNLRYDCLSHLNFTTKYESSSSVAQFKAESSPECKVKNVCG